MFPSSDGSPLWEMVFGYKKVTLNTILFDEPYNLKLIRHIQTLSTLIFTMKLSQPIPSNNSYL